MYVWNSAWSSKCHLREITKPRHYYQASDIDACWTKNQGKHTHIWGLPPLLRERPVLLIAGCHIYIHVFVCVCVCVSMMRGGDGQRLSQRRWHRWALMRTRRCGILFLPRRCGIRAARMFQNENRRFIRSARVLPVLWLRLSCIQMLLLSLHIIVINPWFPTLA